MSSCVFADVMTTTDNNGIPCWSICQYMMTLSSYLSILPLSVVGFGPTYHVFHKGAFTDILLSSDYCQFHPMPMRSSYTFNSLIHSFRNTSDTIHPLLKSLMAGRVRVRTIFFWQHLPLASCS
jgi:hypothetical protein